VTNSETHGTSADGGQWLRLLALAWPIIVQRATQSVVGLADALMVAPLGQNALAAVTTGAFDSFVAIIFPMGTVFIVQSFAAQLRGKGDLEGARRYAWYGLGLALVAGAIGVSLIPLVPRVVALLGYDPAVASLMSSFIAIRLLSVTPIVATEALVNWYGGLGNTRLGMICGLTTMTSNVALNYLLIEPRFGLPGFGVAGSASASVTASTLGLLPVAWAFFRSRKEFPGASFAKLRFSEFRRMLRFGLPNGVNWFLEFGAFVVFINVVVGHLGTSALAAFNVVMQLNSVAFMPAFGMSSAGAILVGEALGASQKDRVPKIVLLTAKLTMVWMLSVGLAYVFVPETLLRLFQSDTSAEEVAFVRVGAQMLLFGCLWQCFDAAAMSVGESLRAAGDTAWPMWARIVLAWAIFVPGGWYSVVVRGGGVSVTMSWVVGYLAALATLLTLRFLSGRWREIKLVEEAVI
jgi:MATE family multidrug resistance protein